MDSMNRNAGAGETAKSLWNADIPNLIRLVRDPHVLIGLGQVVREAAERGNPDLVEPLTEYVNRRPGSVPDGVISRMKRMVRSAMSQETA
jgi:hypothetical protein